MYLSVGFLAVFIPVRIEIARRCSESSCYSASDADLTADAVGRTAERLITGAPPAGWRYTADLAERAGISFGLADLARNVLFAVLLAGVVYVTVIAARNGRRSLPDGVETAANWGRAAAGLGALGSVTALLPALLVGLSRRTQEVRPAVGEAWRETIMVQVGWSFMAAAVLVCILGIIRTPQPARIATTAAAMVLGGTMALTLLANARLSQADRVTPLHAITSEMATAAIHFDPTAGGNSRRCQLVDDYTVILPNPRQWVSGPNVWSELDELMLDIHGIPYCDPPPAGDKRS